MKQKVVLVISMLAILAMFSVIGFVPGDNVDGAVVIKMDSPGLITKWHEARGGQPAVQSNFYDEILAKRNPADIDMGTIYGNSFEMVPGETLIVNDYHVFKFFDSFVREWAEGSYNTINREATISVARLRKNVDADIIERTIKSRDKIKGFDGLNIILDNVFDGEGISEDKATFVFVDGGRINYRPVLKVGDVRLINGCRVELLGYQRDYTLSDNFNVGLVQVDVDGSVYTLKSFEVSDNVNGLLMSVEDVSQMGKITLVVDNAKTVKIL